MTQYTAEKYIHQAAADEITVCKWVRLACRRHLRDIEKQDTRGFPYHFEPEAAKIVIDFFGLLHHTTGSFAGQPFIPEPWQQAITWILFGWINSEGYRRFWVAYIEVARKNGKTFWGAALGLYMLMADGEARAGCYSAATSKDQAKLSHDEAVRMVEGSPELSRQLQVFRNNISDPIGYGKFEPLTKEERSGHGLNIHFALCDELHLWATRALWDVIRTGMGSRQQPLLLAITTAGVDHQSICWKQHERAEKVLEGSIEDDEFFGIIYTLDEDEDYHDPAVWIKANPNYRVSVTKRFIRNAIRDADNDPSELNSTLRLCFDIWTQALCRWMDMEAWARCGDIVTEKQLAGRTCFGGLDLASVVDVAAWVMVFLPDEGSDKIKILPRFFIPKEGAVKREHIDRVPYLTWERQGLVTLTPGTSIDHDWIIGQIKKDIEMFDIQRINFDRWGSARVVAQLEDALGPDVLAMFGQGYASMNAPMKELMRLVLKGGIAHGLNEPLTWMAANVVKKEDETSSIKPDKKKSTEKIDGIVALIMALDGYMRYNSRQGEAGFTWC